MKNQIMMAIAAVGLMTSCATRESHRASLWNLPLPVQHTIRAEAPHGDIARVEKQNYENRWVYNVSFQNPVLNPDLRIASDGTLLNDGRVVVIQEPAGAVYVPPSATVPAPRTTLRFEDLPPAVQAAISARSPNSRIVNVDKKVKTQVIYEVQTSEPTPNQKLRITEDGIVVE